MKPLLLVSLALISGVSSLVAQPMLLLSTQLENTDGAPVQVDYTAYCGGAVITATGTTDAAGYHELYVALPGGQGMPSLVLGEFADCTGAIVSDSLVLTPLDALGFSWSAAWTANYCGEQGGGGGGGGGEGGGCEVSFEVAQTTDATGNPIPSSVSVWMGTVGEGASYTALWDFGDESTSTELYPSHTYAGSGPYLLCLTATFADPAGSVCTATFCDSLSLDEEGMFGFISGFQLNVYPGSPAVGMESIQLEPSAAALFPNPVAAGGDVRWAWPAAREGAVTGRLTDATGVVVRSVSSSHSTAVVSTEGLRPGAYVLTLEQAGRVSRSRLVVVD
jgi:hypothetical protein